MLFKRKNPASWFETFRISVWPRHSWQRSWSYVSKRILRLSAAPHTIAIGVSVGAFASFTPFIGLHFLLAFLLAYIVRGNLLAAALGTFVGNPITFPFIWLATLEVGNLMLNNSNTSEQSISIAVEMKNIIWFSFNLEWQQASKIFFEIWQPILYPMLLGGALLGSIIGLLLYIPVKNACRAFQSRRRDKINLIKKMQLIKQRHLQKKQARQKIKTTKTRHAT